MTSKKEIKNPLLISFKHHDKVLKELDEIINLLKDVMTKHRQGKR